MADGDLFGLSGDEGIELDCAYFFALRLSYAAAIEVGRIRDSAMRTLRVQRPSPVSNDRLHLSLCAPKRLKRLRAPFEESLLRAGTEVSAAGVQLRLQGFDCFSGRFDRPCLVLRTDEEGCASVQLLKDRISQALFKHGFGWDASSLAPHVTLFYADGLAAPINLPSPAVEWFADEVVLIKSRVGHGEHKTVGSWVLR
jgi:2'-5' RNA ligase